MSNKWVTASDRKDLTRAEQNAKKNNSFHFVIKKNSEENTYLELNFVHSSEELTDKAVSKARNVIHNILSKNDEIYNKRTTAKNMITVGGISYDSSKEIAKELQKIIENKENLEQK